MPALPVETLTLLGQFGLSKILHNQKLKSFVGKKKRSIPALPVAKLALHPEQELSFSLKADIVAHCQRLGGLALRLGELFPEIYWGGSLGTSPHFRSEDLQK